MATIQKEIDRRRFLKLSATASGLAIGCGSSGEKQAETAGDVEMRYRPLGNTGLQVSEISFGSAGFDNPYNQLSLLEDNSLFETNKLSKDTLFRLIPIDSPIKIGSSDFLKASSEYSL